MIPMLKVRRPDFGTNHSIRKAMENELAVPSFLSSNETLILIQGGHACN